MKAAERAALRRHLTALTLTLAVLCGMPAAFAATCAIDHRPLNDAEIADLRGEDGHALKLFRELAAKDPDNLSWQERAIRLELEHDKLDEASADAQRLLAGHPASAEALLADAETAFHRGDLEAAMSSVKQALTVDACNPRVIAELAHLQTVQGHHLLAQRAFEVAHKLAPNDFRIALSWADTRNQLERSTAYTSLLTAFPSLSAEWKSDVERRSARASLLAAGTCTVIPAKEPVILPLVGRDVPTQLESATTAISTLINGHREDLEFRSGSDLVFTRSAAQSLGLPRDSPDFRLSNGSVVYYTHVDSLRLGGLEYRGCPATIIKEANNAYGHGWIAAAFFADFALTVDLAKQQLRLDTLPELETSAGASDLWSHAKTGGPEVPSIMNLYVANEPGVPSERHNWMHAYLGSRDVLIPALIGPNTERSFYLRYNLRRSVFAPATARAAVPVAQDPSLPQRVRDGLKGTRYAVRMGEVILPVPVWPEEASVGFAGLLGRESLEHTRITMDFRDSLVAVQPSSR